MHEAVEQGHVGARTQAQMQTGAARHVYLARVGDDEVGTPAQRLLDVQRPDGMRLARVGADNEHRLGLFQVDERVGHGAAAQRLGQTGDGGGMAEAGAVVDVVGAHHGAHELLEDVVLFVGAAGRRETGDSVGPVLVPDGPEALGDNAQRLVPAGRHQLAAPAHQWSGEPVGVVDELEAVAALHAEVALAGPLADRRDHAHHLALVDQQLDVAAAAAVRADGVDGGDVPTASLAAAALVLQGAGGAGGHAIAAHLAVRLDHGATEGGGYVRGKATLGEVQHVAHLHLVADAHAAAAQDALGRIVGDERRVLAGGVGAHLTRITGGVHTEPVGELLQAALPRAVAHQTVRPMVREQQVDEHLALLVDLLSLRAHHHALAGPGGAGDDGTAAALHLDKAQPAGSEGLQPVVLTEGGDVYARRARCLKDGGTGLGTDGSPVDRQVHAHLLHRHTTCPLPLREHSLYLHSPAARCSRTLRAARDTAAQSAARSLPRRHAQRETSAARKDLPPLPSPEPAGRARRRLCAPKVIRYPDYQVSEPSGGGVHARNG